MQPRDCAARNNKKAERKRGSKEEEETVRWGNKTIQQGGERLKPTTTKHTASRTHTHTHTHPHPHPHTLTKTLCIATASMPRAAATSSCVFPDSWSSFATFGGGGPEGMRTGTGRAGAAAVTVVGDDDGAGCMPRAPGVLCLCD